MTVAGGTNIERERGAGTGARALAAAFVAVVAALAAAPRGAAATTMLVFAIPGATAVDPDDLLTYTLALDNQGPTTAGTVWINFTLPTASVFQWDAGLPPTCFTRPPTGSTRHYECTNLAVGNHTFTVTTRILEGPPDGATLSARLAVNYTDDAGAMQPEVTHTANVRMAIPWLELAKVPSASPVDPGASLVYTITVRNVGSVTAGTVWLNDSLPSEVAFVRVQGLPAARCTQEDCRVLNLAAGASQTYEIHVTVGSSVPRGTTFRNWMFTNYTDGDGTRLTGPAADALVEVRVIRDLTLDKVAEASLAYPGDIARFTIWYNNTAASALGATWINDTLPAGVSYVNSTPSGAASGSSVRWTFPSVAPGSHAIDLRVRVPATAANGTVLVNRVSGEYYDAAGQPGFRVEATASLTVSTDLPRFDGFAKVASASTARPGDSVRFTVYYNNTGTRAAQSVVIEDAVPPGTLITNAVPTWTSQSGRRYVWERSNVAPGNHSISYDLILQDAPDGSVVLNFAFLNYTDPTGRSLPGVGPRSASVRVSGPPVGGSGAALLAVGLAVVLGIAGFVAYRTLRAKKTVIDEVFLLHKDGLLIKHYTRRVRPDVDSDILSGMLIAVQNFVNESFLGSEGLQREGKLDELRFGEFKIVIERGKWVVVAAVLSGDPTNRIKDEVKAAIRDLEAALGDTLVGWSGEMRAVEGADTYIQALIAGKYRRAWKKG